MSLSPDSIPTSAETGIYAGTATYRRINLALFCAGFITFVTLYDVQPLLPLFAHEFGVVPAVASLPLSLSTASLAFGMLLAGTLSDSIGRKRLMSIALLLTSLLALATYFCSSFSSLLVIRLLQGVALAGIPSVAMAYLGEEMSTSAISGAMGLYISGNALGGMTGRIGSALLCDYLPWQSAISLIGVLSLAITLVFVKCLPTSARFQKRIFHFSHLYSTVLQQLRDPGLLCLYGLAFLSMGGFVSIYNYIGFRLLGPPYSMNQFDVSLIFLVYLAGSFSSGIVGVLINRFGRPFMIRGSLLTMLAGTLLTLASPLWVIIVGVGIFTCGFFSAHAIASSWVGRRARTGKAQASSIYLFSYYQGSSISGTVGGIFWLHFGWPGVASMISLLIVVALGVAAVLLRLPAQDQ